MQLISRETWEKIMSSDKTSTQLLRELSDQGHIPAVTYSEKWDGYDRWESVAKCGASMGGGSGRGKRAARIAAADALIKKLALG